MNDTKYQRYLHLVTVEEHDAVRGQQPDGVDSHGVGITWKGKGRSERTCVWITCIVGQILGVDHEGVRQLDWSVIGGREVLEHRKVRAKDIERLSEDVIVYEASVNGEASHHEDNVPSSKKYLKYFRRFCLLLKVSLLNIGKARG